MEVSPSPGPEVLEESPWFRNDAECLLGIEKALLEVDIKLGQADSGYYLSPEQLKVMRDVLDWSKQRLGGQGPLQDGDKLREKFRFQRSILENGQDDPFGKLYMTIFNYLLEGAEE